MTSPSTTPPARLTAALADRYRIERELGQGGMATVYLAEDLRHRRKVAIKVVHPELAAVIGPERFLQEIELTASLQHPHILPLFDSGNADGVLYYVMPYVEGETLRARLAREHQLPVSDAVRIAREVADALDYAHKRNVVHRDIKPENILLQNGRPLVADFGIALAVQQAGGARMTQTGMSLGTPQYMAPEQAMGDRSVDARADIYALGVVTYEMLAGAPPFVAPSAQAVVAKVMTEDPRPLIPERRSVPPEVEDAVLTALEKLPADRFATAADFAAALTAPAPRRSRAPAARGRPPALLLLLATILTLAALAAGWLLHGAGRAAAAPRSTRRAAIPLSAEFEVRGSDVAISADGSTLVVTDAQRIRLRRLDRLDLPQVPGSNDGVAPFLSDDGQRIGFVRSGQPVVQGIDGSDQVTLPGPVAEGAFVDAERIVVADSTGLALLQVRTGARSVIAAAPAGRRFLQLAVLPGGRTVLASLLTADIGDARVAVIDIATHRMDTLALGPALAPHYDRGLLYFARPSGALMAVPFDVARARVVGTPQAIGDFAVVARFGHVSYAVGAGVIAYGARSSNRLVAIGRGGHKTVLSPNWGNYHNPRVSPDGTRILVDREEADIVGRDVWILDLRTSTFTRATSVGDGHDAVWAPDGRVTYLSFSTPGGAVVTAPADGGPGSEKISSGAVNPGTWMPDGSAYLAGVVAPRSNSDIVALHRDGRGMDTLVATRYDEHSPAISRDGRWLAYVSDETGTKQVYVRPLRGGGRTLVSDAEGEEPVWAPDGRLYYIEHYGEKSRVRAVRLGAGESAVVLGRSTEIDDLVYQPVGNHANWDILPDGRMVFVEPGAGSEVVLVFDWSPARRSTP